MKMMTQKVSSQHGLHLVLIVGLGQLLLTAAQPALLVGPPGPPGPTGATGGTGPSGVIGATGQVGNTGATGAGGGFGPQGQRGQQGPIGPQGSFGYVGDDGRVGGTGATGAVVGRFKTLPVAVQNATVWCRGVPGPTGPQGVTGATGATGVTGATGIVGAPGRTGSRGPNGPSGYPGATGARGRLGPPGYTGATGATGLSGSLGAPGISSLNSRATGFQAPNEINLATGLVALPGEQGCPGPQGPPGDTGALGDIGVVGATGATGPTGITGGPGFDAANLTGFTGAAGSPGLPGMMGYTGSTGSYGRTGVTGPAGVPGHMWPIGFLPPKIFNVSPNFGPLAGGTQITLIGKRLNWLFLDRIFYDEYLGPTMDCIVTYDTLIAQTPEVDEPGDKEILVKFVDLGFVNNSVPFEFRDNPVIVDVYPRNHLANGGTTVSVVGENLDAAALPLLKITIVTTLYYSADYSNQSTTYSLTACTVSSGSLLTCIVPNITSLLLPEFATALAYDAAINDTFPYAPNTPSSPTTTAVYTRKRRSVVRHRMVGLSNSAENTSSREFKSSRKRISVRRRSFETAMKLSRHKHSVDSPVSYSSFIGANGRDRVDVYVGFLFDGYTKYSNLTSVFQDKLFGFFPPPTIMFNAGATIDFNPNTQDSIEIMGQNLLRGSSLVDYTVNIGNSTCVNDALTDNQLQCSPQKTEPQRVEDSLCPSTLNVVVVVGYMRYEYSCLRYVTNEVNIGLIVGLTIGLGIPIIILIVVVAIYLIKRRQQSQQNVSTVPEAAALGASVHHPPLSPTSSKPLTSDPSYLELLNDEKSAEAESENAGQINVGYEGGKRSSVFPPEELNSAESVAQYLEQQEKEKYLTLQE